jgi:hypothetical protein
MSAAEQWLERTLSASAMIAQVKQRQFHPVLAALAHAVGDHELERIP